MKQSGNIIQITAGELLEHQLRELKVIGGEEYFCLVLEELWRGNSPISSDHVILQFKKAIPKRFRAVPENSCLLDDHLLAKYQDTRTPRINLLKALPPEYEFQFEMVKG